MSVEQRRALTVRLSILQGVISVLFAVLAVSFWVIQIVQHQKYQEMAENNHQRTLALRAPRGVVFDRNLKPLVHRSPLRSRRTTVDDRRRASRSSPRRCLTRDRSSWWCRERSTPRHP